MMQEGKMRIKTVIRLKKRSSAYALFFAAQLSRSSAGLKTIGTVDDLMVMLQIACFLYCFLNRIKRKRFSMLDLSVISFYLCLFISTVMVSRDFFSWLTYSLQGAGAIFLIEDMMANDEKESILVIRNVSFFFLLCNLASVIMAPAGFFGDLYFLGARIGFTPFCIMAVVSALLGDYIVNGKKISITSGAVILAAVVNVAAVRVSTGILGLALLACMTAAGLLLCGIRKQSMVYLLSYGIPSLVWFVIVLKGRTDIFQIILSIVGEDLTFNGRTLIWEMALRYISEKPFWGYGVTALGDFYIAAYIKQRSLPAHDELLNLLYQGGAAAFICWNILYFAVGHALKRCRENYIIVLMSAAVFSFLCIMITEIQSQKAIIFMVIALAYQLAVNHSMETEEHV